ncbi:hypothetical protein ACQR1Y_34585 [Bradyrhizobium sp. HKCCYLRH3099]|uniref:hypothetical protein n=1 Tax=unclassified Bradyrhizobium TaxID=2631580 RepID=UPI003EBE68CD
MKLSKDAVAFLKHVVSAQGGCLVYDRYPDVEVSSLIDAGILRVRPINPKLTHYEITELGRRAISSCTGGSAAR